VNTGTWWLPKGRRVERYGISEPVPATYLDQLAAPMADAARL
jgi:hypothetical protein